MFAIHLQIKFYIANTCLYSVNFLQAYFVCNYYMEHTYTNSIKKFKTLYCGGTIQKHLDGTVSIECAFEDGIQVNSVKYLAARPSDRRASYTGSGFPFASKKQAFENTPTQGRMNVIGNTFRLTFPIPNAYYANLGNKLVLPTLFISYLNGSGKEQITEIIVDDQVPYRFLQFPKQRNDATFYHAHHNLPVRTQEQVLLDSQYPSNKKMHDDYWGLRPAL